MLAHRCEERALLDTATAIESVPGLLGGLAASGWVREVGILLAVTLLTWPLSLLLTHRIPEHVADERRETGVLRRFLRVVVWPLAALMFSAVGLEVLRHLRPDWVGQSSGVLPILGFFLVFRLVNQLLREVLPPGSRRRRLRRVVAPTLFVLLVLQQLQLLDPTIRVIQRPLVTAGDTPISLFSILLAIAVVLGASVVGRIVQALLGHRVLPRMGIEVPVAEAVGTVVRYALVVLGVIIGVEFVGFDLTTLKIAFGALGVGIGFGLQNVVNNFTSGLILLFERTVERGDVLTVDGTDGRVQRVGLRASVLRTREGDDLIMPNSILVENKVINYSYGDELKRVDVPVGVSYRSDPNRVREILLEVARACDDVLAEPEPGVLFEAFGESSIDFTLRSWIDDAWKLPQVRSRLLFEIWYALKADGIEIPFPQRDLHLRSAVELPLRREDEA